jgi:predicted HicB family RNase H-like nuclease
MKYKGYTARIDFDSKDDIFCGRLLGMNEALVFHGASVEELRGDFEFAVDHYLAECMRLGKTPEKPASGKLLLRLTPELHANAIVAAAASDKSMNQWVADTLSAALEK